MRTSEIIDLTQKYVMNTYNRLPVALVKGKGNYVWDAEGKKYLDFFSGLAVTNLGHSHPQVLYAISRQARKLLHVSNLFPIDRQAELAELLVKNSFGDKVFFCNSGAEANEAAVKLARKYAKKKFGLEKYEVITMTNSFHGRTLAMITATGQTKYQKGFEPLVPGFRYAEFGSIDSLKKVITPATCAVMVEPVQGEGGVRLAPKDYFKAVKDLCREKGILLIFDEVQTGVGRTGRLFAYEHFGVEPDLMTLAKALASGLPIGALVAKDFVAEAFEPGDHAATFGGNPFVTAVGTATLRTILKDKLIQAAAGMGDYFLRGLRGIREKLPHILEVRGIGLMLAADLDGPARPVVLKCLEKGLLINAVQEKTLRILPPLTVKKKEIDAGLKILKEVLSAS
jgi:predicted acetylornithine/succinylornithine family transaminase